MIFDPYMLPQFSFDCFDYFVYIVSCFFVGVSLPTFRLVPPRRENNTQIFDINSTHALINISDVNYKTS